jgi:hypothetical protein
MAIQHELFTLLAPVFAGRVYPNAAPDKPDYPYLVYARISARQQQTIEANGGSGNLINTNMQLDIYAKTYAEAQSLSAQIQLLLKSWAMQNLIIFEQDFYEQEEQLHRVLMEIVVWHR